MTDGNKRYIIIRGSNLENLLMRIVTSGLLSGYAWETSETDISKVAIDLELEIPKATIDSVEFDGTGRKILPIADKFECVVTPKVLLYGEQERTEHVMRLVRQGDKERTDMPDGDDEGI